MDEQGRSRASAGTPGESADSKHPAETAECSLTDWRLQKIEQYQREALQNLSAEQGMVAATSGGLYRFALQLEEKIQKTLAKQSDSLELSEGARSAIETHLKVVRQAGQLSRYLLDLRNEAAKLAQRQDEAARRAKKMSFDTHESLSDDGQR